MKFEALRFAGVFKALGSQTQDRRGAFARLVDLDALPPGTSGLGTGYLAAAYNRHGGTVRGLHFQVAPHGETKLVWCTSGSVFDVLVDMRPDQPTYGQWITETLSNENPVSLLLPPGVAHGYQTLADDSTMSYLIDGKREPASERTLKWDDPDLAIPWPLPLTKISKRDATATLWSDLT